MKHARRLVEEGKFFSLVATTPSPRANIVRFSGSGPRRPSTSTRRPRPSNCSRPPKWRCCSRSTLRRRGSASSTRCSPASTSRSRASMTTCSTPRGFGLIRPEDGQWVIANPVYREVVPVVSPRRRRRRSTRRPRGTWEPTGCSTCRSRWQRGRRVGHPTTQGPEEPPPVPSNQIADLGEGALVIDDARRCIAANHVALDLLDAPRDTSVSGIAIEDLSSPLREVAARDVWDGFLRRGADERVVVVPRRDGSRRLIHCVARARVAGRATTGEMIINNRASTQILGLELSGRSNEELSVFGARYPDGRLLGPDDHSFRRVMINRTPVRNQTVILNRAVTAEEIVVRSSAALVDGPDSVPLVVSVLEDITEEHRLLAEHEQVARFAETFVGILAHDLRTLLHAIMMSASLLAGRLSEGGVGVEAGSAHRLERAPHGRNGLSAARSHADPTGGRCPDRTNTGRPGRRPELRAGGDRHREPGRAVPSGDAASADGRMGRSTPRAGDLEPRWQRGSTRRPLSPHRDRPRGARRRSAAHGADPRARDPGDVLPEFFDPFRRRTARAPGRTSGLGLGLYITREVVRAHGGAITVTSTDADGTVFAATLPRSSDRADRAQSIDDAH